MKLTKPQERALACLYRRANQRSWLSEEHLPRTDIVLSAGKQTGVTEPADLLRWDRMEALQAKGLIAIMNYYTTGCNVRLTPLGCQVARERMEKNA